MTACNQIFAVEDMQDDCDTISEIEKLNTLVANQTALDAKTKNNATKADALKTKVAAMQDELTTLSSNTTLTTYCASLKVASTCSTMSKLQKEVDMAANATALDAKFNGNATKIANYQAKAAKAQTKLTAMQSNTTLADTCASLKSTTGAATDTSNTGTTTNASSDAVNVRPVGAMVSLAALFFAGVLLL
jgi:predicted  nucleic acid-binding Zn-ribbon protein